MIEIEQLIQLKAFYKYKTLSTAAKHLHISQPVLTRSMQKLEDELGVSLFERTKNKIGFNDTGLLLVEYADRVLDDMDLLKSQIREYDRRKSLFSIGSCAPAPARELTLVATDQFMNKTIVSELKDMNVLIEGLKDGTYTVIIMPYDIEDDDIESIEFFEETLYFSLPSEHKYSNKKSLTFKEMDGESMLLMSNTGFWYDMHKKTQPNTRFLIQEDRDAFNDVVELSYLPCFVSDYTMTRDNIHENRKIIPISDKEAHNDFYCWYLKKNEKELKTFLYSL